MYDTEARIRYLERRIEQLELRLRTQVLAGRTTMAAKDDGAAQTVQVRLDAFSTRDNIPVLSNYGFFGSPPVGTDMHISFLDGDRSQAVGIASNHQESRFRQASVGDAGIYAHGLLFHLTSGGILMTGDLTQTGNQTIKGDLHVTGAVHVDGEVIGHFGGASVTLTQHKHAGTNAPPTPGT